MTRGPGFASLRPLAAWLVILPTLALAIGSGVALFLWLLDLVTRWQWQTPTLLFLLPLTGLLSHVLYAKVGGRAGEGNALLFRELLTPRDGVPLRMAPLVLLGTLLTHLGGGSAGREGTAIQIGGSLASTLDRWGSRLSPSRWTPGEDEQRRLLRCGLAAGFGAVFGTPLAGALFALEVLTAARPTVRDLLTCLLAALGADLVTSSWGIGHTAFPQLSLAGLRIAAADPVLLAKVLVAALLFGAAGSLFAEAVHFVARLLQRHTHRSWLHPLLGSLVVMGAVLLLGSRDYLGLGVLPPPGGEVSIVTSFDASASIPAWAALAKLGFTAVTVGSGFKGGEVTPLFFVGSTLGHSLALWLQAPVALFAGLGLVAVFAAATRTPLACTVMGLELFGVETALYLAVACFAASAVAGARRIYPHLRRAAAPVLHGAHDPHH